MDPNAIAGMAFTLILTALVGGFIMLYPVSRRLGQLLESKLQNKNGPPALTPAEIEALQQALNSLQGDVHRIAERQDFLEKLLSSEKRVPLPLPPKDV
jgi:hypothetical protein